jgi:preprotein translocase subunit SecY
VLEAIRNIYRVPELRKKIGFTLLLVFIYRVGGHITTPGIDPKVLGEFFGQNNNSLFGLYDLFVGGAFRKATIFAMGIMPYISASIIIQLLGTVFPAIHKLQREGPGAGRRSLNTHATGRCCSPSCRPSPKAFSC